MYQAYPFFLPYPQPLSQGKGLSRFAPGSFPSYASGAISSAAPNSAPGSVPGSIPGSASDSAPSSVLSYAPGAISSFAPGSVPGGAPGATGWRFFVSATPYRLYCRLRSVSYAGCMSWQNYVSHQIQAWHRNKGNLSSHN